MTAPSTHAAPSPPKRQAHWRFGALICGVFALAATAFWGWPHWRGRGSDAEFQQALEELQKGKSERATALVDRWKSVSLRKDHVALLRGAQFEAWGFHERAVEILQELEPKDTLRPLALRWLGVSLLHAGRTIEAQWVLETLASEFPDSVEAHRWLATTYRKIGAMDACLAEYEALSQLAPDDYRPFQQMARIYREDHNREEKAIELYRESLSRAPPESARVEIVRELADALVETHEYADAREILATVADDSKVLALRAECLKALGNRDAAADALRRALELNPRERRALMLAAGNLLETDENPAAAIPLMETILSADPHDYPARNLLALTLRRVGRLEEADQEVARMNESRELRGRLDRLYQDAMRDPSDAAVRDQLAALCRRLGRHDLGEFWRQAAQSVRNAATANESPTKLELDATNRPEAR